MLCKKIHATMFLLVMMLAACQTPVSQKLTILSLPSNISEDCPLRTELPIGATFKQLYDAYEVLGDKYDDCAESKDFVVKAYNKIGK